MEVKGENIKNGILNYENGTCISRIKRFSLQRNEKWDI